MGQRSLAQFHDPAGSSSPVAAPRSATPHRQLRAGNQLPLAHHTGCPSAEMGPFTASIAEQLALRPGLLRLSAGARMGATLRIAAETALGESLNGADRQPGL